MVKISCQSDQRLQRKSYLFCADKQTDRQTNEKSLMERHLAKQNKVEWHSVEHPFDLTNYNSWLNLVT